MKTTFKCTSTTALRTLATAILATAWINLVGLPVRRRLNGVTVASSHSLDVGKTSQGTQQLSYSVANAKASWKLPPEAARNYSKGCISAVLETNDRTERLLEDMVQRESQRPDCHFSACLLIRDDNFILNEWLAYHYHTLKQRYLVVAVDPNSLTTPSKILESWENLTDLKMTIWNDADFMPKQFLQSGFYVPLTRINGNASVSKWHSGFEDEETVKRDLQNIQNHRFRQVTFLSSCYRHMRREKKTWVLHVDTDEYVTINPILRANGMLGNQLVPRNLREDMILLKFLLAIRYRPRLNRLSNYPCISIPRLLFGSFENETLNMVTDTSFQTSKFETLRWKYHTAFDDRDCNALPKVIVDVSVPST